MSKDYVARIWRGSDQIQNVAHRDAAPLVHSRPPLDAEMLGNLLLLGHRFQFRQGKHLGIRNQAADSQRITGELVSCACTVLLESGIVLLGQKCGEISV